MAGQYSVLFRPMKITVYLRIVLLATVSLVLFACGAESQKPAPAGDHAVLEQLADAYRHVGEQFPMQPQAMPPKGRKDFVNRVFAQAGYSYSATLTTLAKTGASITNQDHRDLVDLLLLPGKGLSDENLASIYSADEVVAVRQLRAIFR